VFPEALIEELVRLDPRCLGEGEEAEVFGSELGAAALGVSVHGWVEVACGKYGNAAIRIYLVKRYLRGWSVLL